MPPLIAAVLIGFGAYAGVKAVQRAVAGWSTLDTRTARTAEARASSAIVEKDLGTLELDPATGVYRPAKPLS